MSTSLTGMQKIRSYFSLIKFSHTIFALPFALIGFTLAVLYEQKSADAILFIKILLCMVFARTAAMAFNRYLDREIDAKNPRTTQREIPAGIIKPQNALIFTIVNSVLFILTTLFINLLVFYLSFIAIFVVLFYSYTKRFTALCHVVLGIGLALAPIGAFLAVTGYFMWLPLIFSFIVLTWVSGFDIIYALQDEQFDKEQKLHSIPATFGVKGALNISNILHLITAVLVIAAGLLASFNFIYWIGAVIFIGLLFYQHLLVKPNDLSKVNIAFMTTNGIGSIVFAVFTILSLIF
ncbi:MAG: UbiA-like polyprenyltransferase [Flavipsychrobacter sp.]